MNTWDLAVHLLPIAFLHTLYMVAAAAVFALLLGLPIGILLFLTSNQGLRPLRPLYVSLSCLVNIGRSIPFAILIVAIFPFTRLIVGTSIGTTAAIVPLTLAAAPFFARLVQSALLEVPTNIIEVALVMGSTSKDIVRRVLLPEALPSLVRGISLTVVNLIGLSAMAGLVGGGGLGKIAIQYGYQRFNGTLMLLTLLILLLLVESVQWIGEGITRALVKKRGLGK